MPFALHSAGRARISSTAGDHLVDGRRVEEARGVAADLGQRSRVRARDGTPARHRLERRLAEALVEAREDEPGGGPVQPDELLAPDVPERAHPGRRRAVVGREHELEVRDDASAAAAKAANSRSWFLCGQARAG